MLRIGIARRPRAPFEAVVDVGANVEVDDDEGVDSDGDKVEEVDVEDVEDVVLVIEGDNGRVVLNVDDDWMEDKTFSVDNKVPTVMVERTELVLVVEEPE